MVNALKLYLKHFGHSQISLDQIHRPRRSMRLPHVLSRQEVKRILEALGNRKHRAMLSLIYACGLRRSEVLNLKLTDVQSDRGLLFVAHSKGDKDRVVPLSPECWVSYGNIILITVQRSSSLRVRAVENMPPKVCNWYFRKRLKRLEFASRQLCIGCGIATQPIYSRVERTFVTFRNYLVIAAAEPQNSTPT